MNGSFIKYLLLILLVTIFWTCTEEDPIESGPVPTNPGQSDNSWLIPSDEVVDGGPGKDGIPAIDNPKFHETGLTSYLRDDDLILGIKVGNEIRGYSHPVLDWHEIVNDQIGNLPFSITYCPLTGTGIGWIRRIDNYTTTFGVSGLLYRNNLIPYDRQTNSYWSQMRMEAVKGQLKPKKIVTHPLVEIPWSLWKKVFPNSKVITTETGYNRSYGRYPYGDYKNNSSLLFPVGVQDDRLQAKERVFGVIIDGNAKVYRFNSFKNGTHIVEDTFQNKKIVVIGNQEDNFIIAYEVNPDTMVGDFHGVAIQEGGVVMSDGSGNLWTIFGEAISGPLIGHKLNKLDGFIGYWFAFGAFYPKPEIYE